MTLSWSRLWASWFRGLKARSKNCVVFPGFSIELMTFGICAFQINIGFPHERWRICVGWYVELPDFWEAPVIFHIPIILTVQFPFEQWLLSTLLVDDFLGEQLLAQILGIINREILKNQAEKHIASGIFCGQLFSFPMKKNPIFSTYFPVTCPQDPVQSLRFHPPCLWNQLHRDSSCSAPCQLPWPGELATVQRWFGNAWNAKPQHKYNYIGIYIYTYTYVYLCIHILIYMGNI